MERFCHSVKLNLPNKTKFDSLTSTPSIFEFVKHRAHPKSWGPNNATKMSNSPFFLKFQFYFFKFFGAHTQRYKINSPGEARTHNPGITQILSISTVR